MNKVNQKIIIEGDNEFTEVPSRKIELGMSIQKIEQEMIDSQKYQKKYLNSIAGHFRSVFWGHFRGDLHCYLNCLRWQLGRQASLVVLHLWRLLVCR